MDAKIHNHLENECDLFLEHISTVMESNQKKYRQTFNTEDEFDLAHVVISLYHAGVDLSKGVAICSKQRLDVPARTCLRALVEVAFDTHVLLQAGGCYENAARFLAHGYLELVSALRNQKDADAATFSQATVEIDNFIRRFPSIQIMRQRYDSGGYVRHWSMLRQEERLQCIPKALADEIEVLYRRLSWDAHGQLLPFRNRFEFIDDGKVKWSTMEEHNAEMLLFNLEKARLFFDAMMNKIFSASIFQIMAE